MLSLLLTASVAHAQGGAPVQPPPTAPPPPIAATAPPGAPVAPPQPTEGEEVRTANNAIFLELLGNGLFYSINYERLFGDSGFSLRAGFSYMSISASSSSPAPNTAGSSTTTANASILTFPVLANYYLGGKDHKLQLGVGATFISLSASTGLVGSSSGGASGAFFVPAPTVAIGYRYIPARGGFTFFIGLTPFILPGAEKTILPWGGMSFGGAF